MKANDHQEGWVFKLFVEADDNGPVPYELADKLLDDIVAAAEARGLQIGGGFRPPAHEENTLDIFSGTPFEEGMK